MPMYVLSPAGVVTGGPESMHQLVHKARSLGLDAAMHYYGPDALGATLPEAYRHYDVAVAAHITDTPDSVVVVPETATTLLNSVRHARKAVWWLSVDAFVTQNAAISQQIGVGSDRGALDFVFDPRRQITHLTHSEYGRIFLAMNGTPAHLLGDYISDKITAVCAALADIPKRDRVAYNPRKGKQFTDALMAAAAGSVEWVPIQGMTAEQVAETLAGSKLYIDFGEHPGQDHLPKEAALAGCCVLTGTRGSAGNGADIPIPKRFKLNEASPDALSAVLATIRTVFSDFDELTREFDAYRSWILSHERQFTNQIADIFAKSGPLSVRARRR